MFDVLDGLEVAIGKVAAEGLRTIGEYDRSGGWSADKFVTPAAAVRAKCRSTSAMASRSVRLALNGQAVRMGDPGKRGSVEIERLRREDQAAVRRLILEGLEEHWGALDPQLNTDLDDIEASYAVGTVLVARDSGQIVGVGAIVPVASGEGEVKRMSVARDARRRGLGTALLLALLEDAKRRGWHSVRLETTADWEDAVLFYGAFGFELTHYEDGGFGRDAHFRLGL